jgi:hypothetical protein
VNGTSIPRIDLNNVKVTTNNGVTMVSGNIRQANAPDTLVTSVPIYAEGGELLGRVFAEGPETTFRLKAPTGARKVVLDPYDTILRRK